MIDAARAKLRHIADRLHLLVQDYGVADWVTSLAAFAPFDVIVSGFSIHHQPDARKRELYAEIYDLLKPGGVFVNIEHVAPATQWVESLGDELFIDSMYEFNQRNGIPKTREEAAFEFYNRPHKEANILAPLEIQCGWLREIGFQHVDCYLKIFELAVFGGIKS